MNSRKDTGTRGHLMDMLSRSRPHPSAAGNAMDSTVIRLSQLRTNGEPAVALVKVARDARAAATLLTQRRLVAEIAGQPGLDADWRELVPRILAVDERVGSTVCVESYRPGVGLADVLAGHPDRRGELTALALDAIAPLHRATARPIVVDQLSSVRQWVVAPVTELAGVCARLDRGLLPGLENLETILTRAVVGRRMTVCWTHGDYTPANVQLSGPRGQVNRISTWDKARGDRLALVDRYSLILTVSAQAEGTDLGDVVGRRLRGGGLLDCERDALDAVAVGADRIDERVAILLYWLQRTARISQDGADQPVDLNWLARNVVPVIGAVSGWHGFDAADGPTAA